MARKKPPDTEWRPGFPADFERYRARVVAAKPLTPEDYIKVEANAIKEAWANSPAGREWTRRSREAHLTELGKRHGQKGGRPSTKPPRGKLRALFELELGRSDNSWRQARASVVKALAKEHKITPHAASNWLKDAGIDRKRKKLA